MLRVRLLRLTRGPRFSDARVAWQIERRRLLVFFIRRRLRTLRPLGEPLGVADPRVRRGRHRQRHDDARRGVRPVVVRAGQVVHFRAADDESDELLAHLGDVEQLDLPGVERDFEILVELRLGLLRNLIADAVLGEVGLESQPGVAVAGHAPDAVAP